jgi:hypothetical protein
MTRAVNSDSVLVTRHLKLPLPYRALYSQTRCPETATRTVDALLAVLLVRLHIIGFFWATCRFQHTLPAGTPAPSLLYLVDAVTGQLYTRPVERPAGERLPRSRREHRGRAPVRLAFRGRVSRRPLIPKGREVSNGINVSRTAGASVDRASPGSGILSPLFRNGGGSTSGLSALPQT